MRINHVIKTMVFSDFYIEAGLALFGPIFAIFITEQIQNGSIATVGFAAAITQVVKITFEIPIAKYLDRNHGEYDDFYSMLAGTILISLVPFLYLFASTINHIYIIAGVLGLGTALFVPPRLAIFTRHIDKLKENLEWSFKSVSIGIAAAGAAALGGFLAERIGFRYVFVLAGIAVFVGAIIELKIFADLKAKVPQGQVKPEPKTP